jgi:hypothetical protein
MAKKRREPIENPRRLGWAAGLLALSLGTLAVIFSGAVFKMTQGAEIGLYLTVVLLMIGFGGATGSMVLAARTVFRRRPTKPEVNIIDLAERRKQRGRVA